MLLYDIPEPGTEPEPEPGPAIQPTVGGMELRGCYPLDPNNGNSLTLVDVEGWGRMDNKVGV